VRERYRTAAREHRPAGFDYRMTAADGRTLWLREFVNLTGGDGHPERLVGVLVDVTAAKATEHALEYVSGLQRTLVEVAGQLTAAGPEAIDAAINEALRRVGEYCGVDRSYVLGLAPDAASITATHEWCARGVGSLGTGHRSDQQAPEMLRCMANAELVLVARTAELGPAWARERAILQGQGVQSLILVPQVTGGQVAGYVGFDAVGAERAWQADEIRLLYGLAEVMGAARQRERAERDTRRVAARLTNTLESMTDAFFTYDHQWRFSYVNAEAERLTQRSRDELLGKVVWEEYPDLIGSQVEQEFRRARREHRAITFEFYYSRPRLWLEINAYPTEEGLAVHFRDVTERKRAREEIEFHALYDSLTHLPNRRLLMDRLQHALAGAARMVQRRAVLFLDLDDFKALNDTLGHDVGDRLLQAAAQRLAGCLRDGDTVARFGGDEFAVIASDLGTGEQAAVGRAIALGEKIRAALSRPFTLNEHERHTSPSIGITLLGRSGEQADAVMKRADQAMYQAKEAGRGTVQVFDAARRDALHSRIALQSALRSGLARDEIEAFYQPQVDLAGDDIGAEALARWHHPERGVVMPDELIPVAADSGLLPGLGEIILASACERLAAWSHDPARAHLTLAVNVTTDQFHHADFVGNALAVLERTGAPGERLILELTQGLLLADIEATVQRMNRLRAAGVRFALDDFGSGHASLTWLKRLPLAQLKIDRDLFRDARMHEPDAAIVRAVIELAQTLGMHVLAEPVTTQTMRDWLAANGCTAYQGFLLGEPMPGAALEQRLQAAARSH
jgi:diguanylate cyclase (GGDEF)-like protein/PAS domain S-box-containing protein